MHESRPQLAVLHLLLGVGLLGGCGGPSVGSIGAVLGRSGESGVIHVRDVPVGNAADRAGLQPGDEIVFVDGRDVRDLDVAALRRHLRGEPGSHVALTVLRHGKVVRVEVERRELGAATPPKPPGEERLEE